MRYVSLTPFLLGGGKGGREGGGGGLKNVYPGGSHLRSNPVSCYIPFLTTKVPLSYTFY